MCVAPLTRPLYTAQPAQQPPMSDPYEEFRNSKYSRNLLILIMLHLENEDNQFYLIVLLVLSEFNFTVIT